VAAATFLVAAARRGGAPARLLSAAGAVLAARALHGADDLGAVACACGLRSSVRCQTGRHVDRASEQSFPASDAPSWTATSAASG
jgi:hypothetical protein